MGLLAVLRWAEPATFFDLVPFNLTGWLFFKGILEINTNPDRSVSAAYFDAAFRAGLLLMQRLEPCEVEDFEIVDLSKLARLHAIFCLADTDLELGKAEFARFRSLPADLMEQFERQWRISPSDRETFAGRFVARYPQLQQAVQPSR